MKPTGRQIGITMLVTAAISVPCIAGGVARASGGSVHVGVNPALATITVNETAESAQFSATDPVTGLPTPTATITDVSDHDGKCSLREAIEAANTAMAVDGCPAGGGAAGTTITIPAGTYDVKDYFQVTAPINFVGANAGIAGNDPARGPETIIRLLSNIRWNAHSGMFWQQTAGNGAGIRIDAAGGASAYNGIDFQGSPAPEGTCGPTSADSSIPCEEEAIVDPAQPSGYGGGAGTQSFTVKDSIIENFTGGLYLGGSGALVQDNLFRDNYKNPQSGVIPNGTDIYSDGVYPVTGAVIRDNVFAEPVVGIDLEGYENGVTIQDNVFPMSDATTGVRPGSSAVNLVGATGTRVIDNAIVNTPVAGQSSAHNGILLANAPKTLISGNTIVGTAVGVYPSDFGLPQGPSTGIVVTNNRIYLNDSGISVYPDSAFTAGAIVANQNWWGSNGGPGTRGARPGAPQPVNGIDYWNANGDLAPGNGSVVAADWLKLACTTSPRSVQAGDSGALTGVVAGMPTVKDPLFTTVAMPVMDASASPPSLAHVSGFGLVPPTGIRDTVLQPPNASLTGRFTGTTVGQGSLNVALDSEQVPCSLEVTARTGSLEVIKTISGPAAGDQGRIVIHVTCGHPAQVFAFRIPARTRAGTVKRVFGGIRGGSACRVTEVASGATSSVWVTVRGSGAHVKVPPGGKATARVADAYHHFAPVTG